MHIKLKQIFLLIFFYLRYFGIKVRKNEKLKALIEILTKCWYIKFTVSLYTCTSGTVKQ